jgi:hypothetical protein
MVSVHERHSPPYTPHHNFKGGGGVYNIKIADVNNDGWNDIIEGSNENSTAITKSLPFILSSRIL